MPDSADLSDEHVARLLKEDAEAVARRRIDLASYGSAPKRPADHGNRLNTRFLKNIIQEAQQHNAHLAGQASNIGNSVRSASHDRPSRRSRDPKEADDLFSSKRRRTGALSRSPEHFTSRDHDARHPTHRRMDRDLSHRDSRHRRHRERSEDSDEHRSSRRRRRHHRHDSSRERRRPRSRSRSPRTRSRDRKREVTRKDAPNDGRSERTRADKDLKHASEEESDPLESIIGPKLASAEPRIRRRGRGVSRIDSGIDERFSSKYDPALDVHPDQDDGDEWEQALEAMRDRQRWKQQGAERLRTAGFSESQISQWEKKDRAASEEEDVRWSKRGEGREWDRGKVVAEDDSITTKPNW